MFLLLLGVPTLLTVGLVVLIRAGQSDVHHRVIREPSSSTPAAAPGATPARKGVRLVRIGSFDSPLYVTSPPRDRRRIFVVEQTGKIRVLVGGKKRSRPFL